MEVSVRAVRRIESLEEFELNKASKERFYSFVFGKIEGLSKLKSEIRKEALKPNEPLLFHGSKQGIEGGIIRKRVLRCMILDETSSADAKVKLARSECLGKGKYIHQILC